MEATSLVLPLTARGLEPGGGGAEIQGGMGRNSREAEAGTVLE